MKTNFMRKTLSLALALVMALLLIPVSPMQVSAAPAPNTWDVNDLADFASGAYADYDEVPGGTDNYFTLIMSKSSKTMAGEYSFEDGAYVATKKLSFNGAIKNQSAGIFRGIRFTTDGAATVKIYWVSGGDGREVTIWDQTGTSVATSAEGSVKDGCYATELAVTTAGTYYVGGSGSNSYFCRVDVTETPAPTGDTMNAGSLTLEGNIGVNFYMQLTEATLADTGAKMVFTVGDVTTEVPVSEGLVTENGVCFTYPVAAKQMNDTITAKIVRTDGAASEEFTYSVRTYCENKLKEAPTADNEKLQALCKAMLNYGAAAQTHFGYNTENLANAGLETGEVTLQDPTRFEGWKTYLRYNDETAGITVRYGTLVLESGTAVRVYFELADGANMSDYEIAVEGAYSALPYTVAATKDGAYQVLTVENIVAQDLENSVIITVSKGGNQVLKMLYSAYSYAYSVLTREETTPELKLLVSALIEYNKAANGYFPAHN